MRSLCDGEWLLYTLIPILAKTAKNWKETNTLMPKKPLATPAVGGCGNPLRLGTAAPRSRARMRPEVGRALLLLAGRRKLDKFHA